MASGTSSRALVQRVSDQRCQISPPNRWRHLCVSQRKENRDCKSPPSIPNLLFLEREEHLLSSKLGQISRLCLALRSSRRWERGAETLAFGSISGALDRALSHSAKSCGSNRTELAIRRDGISPLAAIL
jgi:hypothetical protein